jgi:hypothetical protein
MVRARIVRTNRLQRYKILLEKALFWSINLRICSLFREIIRHFAQDKRKERTKKGQTNYRKAAEERLFIVGFIEEEKVSYFD